MSIERAIEILRDCENILVFTGAGISTDSGIPDFRGPDGVWTRVDPEEFTIQRYLANPESDPATRVRSPTHLAHAHRGATAPRHAG